MRVALVCDWFLPRMGGIELHLRDLALALRAIDVDARVVTTTPGPDIVEGVPVVRIAARLLPRVQVAADPIALRRLAEHLRFEGFDVVHAHASVVSPVAYAGAVAASRACIPTVLTFHSMLHRAAAMLGLSEMLLGWAHDRVVLTAVSSVVARQAGRWMPGASIGVLPNGVDSAFWSAMRRDTADDDIVFVSAMRLSRKKRPASLVRAFAEAVRFVVGAPRLRLRIAGDGPARASLRRLADELGVGSQVELLGHRSRDELRDLYAGAHVFVLPSERESFGLAALEARAAGLPVLGMLESGVRDFVVQGRDGLLARDERELSRFMSRFALDAPFRSFVARHNVVTPAPYDWSDVVAMHLRHYGEAGLVAAKLRESRSA